MPDPAGTYTDGGLKFGSQILTIKDASGTDVQYIAEAFSLERKSNWLVAKNESGVPNKQAGQKDVGTANATLQFPTADTKAPKQFAEFTAVEAGGTNVTLIVADIGQQFGNDQ